MIYVSTGGSVEQTAFRTACGYFDAGLHNVEMSGGVYDPDIIDNIQVLLSKGNIQLHNYFPPPKNPFVLNLASFDHGIHENTKNHIHYLIELAAEVGIYIYSFHAGFLFDPQISELGKGIDKRVLNDRKIALDRFIDNVNDAARYAEKLGVLLLIENNVISHKNYQCFGDNPFLMVDKDECELVMRKTASNVRLLIDLAHLKVSATSLGFDKVEFLKMLDPWIYAYHLSDNDGASDSNREVREDSWFWPYIRTDLDYFSLEVYGRSSQEMVKQVGLVEKMLDINDVE